MIYAADNKPRTQVAGVIGKRQKNAETEATDESKAGDWPQKHLWFDSVYLCSPVVTEVLL